MGEGGLEGGCLGWIVNNKWSHFPFRTYSSDRALSKSPLNNPVYMWLPIHRRGRRWLTTSLVLLTDWAVHLYEELIWNQCIWHGLGPFDILCGLKKIKGWLIQLSTNMVNLLLRKILLGELSDVCPSSVALVQVATARWDFSDAATHSSCPTYPGCFLSWGRSILLQGSP